MTKIKLAFVVSGLSSGGAERVVSTLANTLSKTYEVHIISLKKTEPFYPLHPEIRLSYCADRIPPSTNPFQALMSNIRLMRSLYKNLKRDGIHQCISFATIPNLIAILPCRRLRIPVIISERNNPRLDGASLSRIWKWIRKQLYPKADFLVVQTQGIASFYKDMVKAHQLRIIPNPLNPDFHCSPNPERKPIVLNVGRLHHQKNQELLIRAFARTNRTDWELHIYGEGDMRLELEALAKELGVADRVRLPGVFHPISEKYQECGIFAFTSRFEGFPNALMEAMYFGMACISTDCPTGPSELIENGVNGYLIPVNGEDELTDRLIELMSDASLRLELGETAHATMEAYETGEVVSKWESLLETVRPTSKMELSL